MSGITLEFNHRNQRFLDAEKGLIALGRKLEDAPKRMQPELRRELHEFLHVIADKLVAQHGTGYPGGTTATSLSKRSGAAIKSIKASVKTGGTDLASTYGVIGGVGYLRIHETGGVVKSTKSKYLAIPLSAALNANGTPIKPGPRFWLNTFVATSKKGNLIIFQRRGKEIVPLYVLKKSVTIKARLGMEKTLRGGLDYFVDKAVEAMLKVIL